MQAVAAAGKQARLAARWAGVPAAGIGNLPPGCRTIATGHRRQRERHPRLHPPARSTAAGRAGADITGLAWAILPPSSSKPEPP